MKPVVKKDEQGVIIEKYDSVGEAAKAHQGRDSTANLRRSITTGIKYAGFHWDYDQQKDFKHVTQLPNILLLDIETAPMLVYSWGLFKPFLNYGNIVEDWCMLSWAGKWLFQPEVFSDVVTPKEAVHRNDKRICQSVFEVMEKADIIIAHNGKKFDIRKINSRFLMHGINPPSSYQVIDTLLESRKNFAHSSHRLDYLGQMLVNKEKLETDFGLWKKCLEGDQESLTYMDVYCKQDTLLLEEVYMQIRGWMKQHPNLGLYAETEVPICKVCMCDEMDYCGEYVTPANVYDSIRCKNCGAIMRMPKTKLKYEDRLKLRM